MPERIHTQTYNKHHQKKKKQTNGNTESRYHAYNQHCLLQVLSDTVREQKTKKWIHIYVIEREQGKPIIKTEESRTKSK